MIFDDILIQCKSIEININLCISSQLPRGLALDFLYSESSLKLPNGLFARLHLETVNASVSVVAAEVIPCFKELFVLRNFQRKRPQTAIN